MRLSLVAVGKLQPHFRTACDDYHRRLSRFVRVEEIEVREASRLPEESQRSREAERIGDRIVDGSTVVALAREGSALTSRGLARRIEEWRNAGKPLAFVVGGSRGLADTILERAAYTWSLGPLTLPHQLARVVIYEQLYRAFTILNGMPYHKGGA